MGYVDKGATSIAVSGNDVYVCAIDSGNAVYGKDGVKTALPKQGLMATATAITFYGSDIYIGGAEGNTAVYWKNGVKVSLCCSQYGAVSGIAVLKKR